MLSQQYMSSKRIEKLEREDWLKRYLTTEIKYLIGIIVFVAGVVAPYYQIKQDIAIIQENHFSHMEQMSKEIADNGVNIKELKETQITLMGIIAENSVRLKIIEE